MLDSIPISCFRPLVVVNPRFRKGVNHPDYWKNRELYWRDFTENYYLRVPCGKCFLCRKKKANGWRIRLIEESKSVGRFRHCGIEKYRIIFVCFTFDSSHIPKDERRDTIAVYIRKWRDLWRKKYGKSPRYFATTDKGSQFGRIHLHLLIFNPYDYKNKIPLSINKLKKQNFFWRNGFARYPSWVESEKAISYVTGYLTGSNLGKDAIKHSKPICKEALRYVPYVFVSNGLGASFLENGPTFYNKNLNMYMYYYQGFNYGLPQYYRYKLVDYEFRWHQNLIYKKEVEDYYLRNPFPIYNMSGEKYTFDKLESIYKSSFAKYDVKDKQYLKIL